MLLLLVLHANKQKKNNENLPLINTKWVLKEILGMPIMQNSDTAFIIFYDTYKFSGNLGCNLFFGEFNFGKKRIKIDYFGATKKYCTNMTLEEQFVKVLRDNITHYSIDKKRLYLLVQNKVICTFEGIASLQ